MSASPVYITPLESASVAALLVCFLKLRTILKDVGCIKLTLNQGK